MLQLREHNDNFGLQARHVALGGPGAELHRAEEPGRRVRVVMLGAFQRLCPLLDAGRGDDVPALQGQERLREILFPGP